MLQSPNTKHQLALAIKTAMLGGTTLLGVSAMANETPNTTLSVDTYVVNQSASNPTPYTVSHTSASTGLDLTLKETPQLISTMTAQRIKDQDAKNVAEVLRSTTAINVASTDGGRLNFNARGFAINQFQVDGMDMDFNQQLVVGDYHLGSVIYDAVEVTHGATGLLSGSGEPSARVNLVRKRANNTTPATEITVSGNQHGNYGASIDHARGLTADGRVRGRVIVAHSDGDTFLDREEKGESRIYAVVDADISDKTSAGFGVNLSELRQHGTMWGGLPAYFTDGSKTDWDVSKSSSVDWSVWDNRTYEVFGNIKHELTPNWQAELKTNYRVLDGETKLFYHVGNAVDKVTGLGTTPNPYRSDNDYKQLNVQADVKGKFDLFGQTHQLMLGASHNKMTQIADTYTVDWANLPKTTGNFLTWDGSYPEYNWGAKVRSADVTMKENGAYVATQLKANDKLSVLLGSRLSEYERTGTQWGAVNEKAENAVTPYAGITYALNPESSIYASYTNIFKPQSRRDMDGKHLDAETGNTYEIGFKSSVLDDKLQTQAGIFYTQKDNVAQILGQTDYVKGTENSTKERAYRAIDGAESQGFELEVSGKFTDNLMGTLGYTFVDATKADGSPLNTSQPRHLIKAFATYDMNRFINGLTVGAGVDWTSERFDYLTNPATKTNEKYGQKPFALVDLMARYAITPNLDAQVNLHNALNTKYLSGAGFSQPVYGEPRTVSGSLTYRF